jgi:hypothetical protein
VSNQTAAWSFESDPFRVPEDGSVDMTVDPAALLHVVPTDE